MPLAHDVSVAPIDDATLAAALDDWLPPLLDGKRRFDDDRAGCAARRGRGDARLGRARAGRALAPDELRHARRAASIAIDYAAEAGPTVELRPQALFGLASHPTVGRGVPLVLRLTSPAGRPIQTTRDLPGFWAGSWAAVAKEMRGRYPRHPWPDDPAAAVRNDPDQARQPALTATASLRQTRPMAARIYQRPKNSMQSGARARPAGCSNSSRPRPSSPIR